jgi:hypothetical protein
MTRHLLESGDRRPDMNMTGFAGVPEACPFFLASGGLGILLGLILYWKHR